jgi:hypothetical protein
MKLSKTLLFVLLAAAMALILSACSGTSLAQQAGAAPPEQEEASAGEGRGESQTPSQNLGGTIVWADGQPRLDEQGAVTVEVKSLNLNDPGETLDFEVALNTHSVDLSMDLAALTTLTTDTGKTVPSTRWEAPMGGHHVSGTLSFPASVDGSPVLENASKLTLTIVNLDVPQRTFEWNR